MNFTKMPYFFWLMTKKEFFISQNKIFINDVEYYLKSKNKYIFLLLRYLPFFIVFGFTFNQYDFNLTNEKIIHYAGAILMFLSIVLFKRIGEIIVLISVVVIASLSVANYINVESMTIQFILKYLIFIYVIYDFYRYRNSELYEILENNKIKTHLIILKEKN